MIKKTRTNYLVSASLLLLIWLIPTQATQAQAVETETFTLDLKNTDIISLIEIVSLQTNTNFIVDPRVKASVNVISPGPVDADKLYEIFLSVLEIHGYAAVQAGSLVKIVPTSVGLTSAAPVLSDTTKKDEELVTQVIQLDGMSSSQLIETLRPLLSEGGSISAQATNNMLIVTDRAANIQKLINLISKIQ